MSSAGLVSMSPFREESMAFLPPPLPGRGQESILIYVAMSGSLVPMRVMESDSIQSVKLRIQSCKGIFTRNQKLVCEGWELARSDSLVSDYGVSKGNVLHLVLRISDLQVVSVATCCGKEFTYHVERNQNVGHIKSQIAKNGGVVDIDDREILLDGEPVEDQRLIYDLSKNGTDATIHLFVRKSAKVRATPVGKNFEVSIVAAEVDKTVAKHDDDDSDAKVQTEKPRDREIFLEPVIVNPKIELHEDISELIKSTMEGLERGRHPTRSSEGTGGAYFMSDTLGTKYLSVFKPSDEEPMALNNPRGLPFSEDGEGLKKGTRVGEGALRECAVYLLDHPKNSRRSFSGESLGFAGVPPTVYVTCLHRGFNHPRGVKPKTGSLQMFVENDGSCEDMGPGAFPVEEVHKIAVLDMRMANADRHAGNILVCRANNGKISLVPIDHGYCLPYSFEDCTFEWLYWPQACQPFDEGTAEYIRSMDAEQDIALLRFYGWDPPLECTRVLRVSTMLLKKGAEKGLTPFAIGNMMCREIVSKESVVEEIVREALDSVLPGSSEIALMESVSGVMDRRLGEMV